MQSTKLVFAKLALWLGSTLTFLSIAAASIITYPTYALEYYGGAVGLSLIIVGALTFVN